MMEAARDRFPDCAVGYLRLRPIFAPLLNPYPIHRKPKGPMPIRPQCYIDLALVKHRTVRPVLAKSNVE